MVIAFSVSLLFHIMAQNFHQYIGYVEYATHEDHEETNHAIDGIDSLTISFEVIARDAEDTDSLRIGKEEKTFPKVIKETRKPNVERSITFKSEDLQDVDDVEYFEKLKEDYLAELIEEIPPGKSRTDLVVRYYSRSGDNENGIFQLRELRYYIHERTTNGETVYYPNNFISYGKNIKKEDIQIVAYTLIKNGIPIKSIKPSKFGSSWKANSIEISNDTSLNEERVLSLSEVRGIVQ